MKSAKTVVGLLLEELTRICAACEQEHGAVPIPKEKKTHALCKRHLIQQWQDTYDYGLTLDRHDLSDRAAYALSQVKARPESDFPPDLSNQYASVAQSLERRVSTSDVAG